MNKTTSILIITALLLIIPVMAASSENDEQTLAFEGQDSGQQSAPEEPKDNVPITIIGIVLIGLWYYKNKNGGKTK